MVYIVIALFIFGILYPVYYGTVQKKDKEYFKECLDLDIYYPNTDYINEHDMEEPVKSHKAKMLEIAEKYMKNPEFEDEYLRRYKSGFEMYKEENREDLEEYLRLRHEKNMQDPEYAQAYEQYAKMEKKKDIQGRLYKSFMKARDSKPNKKYLKDNINQLTNRKSK